MERLARGVRCVCFCETTFYGRARVAGVMIGRGGFGHLISAVPVLVLSRALTGARAHVPSGGSPAMNGSIFGSTMSSADQRPECSAPYWDRRSVGRWVTTKASLLGEAKLKGDDHTTPSGVAGAPTKRVGSCPAPLCERT